MSSGLACSTLFNSSPLPSSTRLFYSSSRLLYSSSRLLSPLLLCSSTLFVSSTLQLVTTTLFFSAPLPSPSPLLFNSSPLPSSSLLFYPLLLVSSTTLLLCSSLPYSLSILINSYMGSHNPLTLLNETNICTNLREIYIERTGDLYFCRGRCPQTFCSPKESMKSLCAWESEKQSSSLLSPSIMHCTIAGGELRSKPSMMTSSTPSLVKLLCMDILSCDTDNAKIMRQGRVT